VRLGILISGRGSNMRAIVGAVERGELDAEIAVVASNKRNADGLRWARERGLHTAFASHRGREREDFERELDGILTEARVDLVVLAGFMRILSPFLVNRRRIVNIHPSLLPLYPGMDAQRQALAAGATVSGCTVHFVDEGTDTGPVIAQTQVPILPGDDEDSLSQRILAEEHKLFPRAIQMVAEGRVGHG